MDICLLLIVFIIILLFSTKERLPNFPHAYYKDYINDLDSTSVRLIDPEDIQKFYPKYKQDIKKKYNIRNNGNSDFYKIYLS